jgi:serine/threonine-protein kinase
MNRCPQCSAEYPETTKFCPRDGGALVAEDPMIGRVIGRYRVLSRIGKGGMGSVYRGEHLKMRRATAIKVLAPSLAASQEFAARFQREAELASTINHPNAVAIYDFGEDDGLVYLAMELLDGEPLSDRLRRERTLPLDAVVRIARQAADALDAAHRRGIIHRDFKPDNVMLCGGGEVVKVVDFGIAKQTDAATTAANLTQTGSVLGTPTYMSPEQVADHALDPRSDLYSLALTVYQMLSGSVPFTGDTAQRVMVMRLIEAPVPLRVRAPAIPPAVEAVVMKALAREPHQRQSGVLEFARDLEGAASSTAVIPAVTAPHGLPAAPSYPTPAPVPTPTAGGTTPHTTPHYTPTPHTLHAVDGGRRGGSGAKIAVAVVAALALLVVVPAGGYAVYRAFFAGAAPGPGPGPTPPGPPDTAEAVPYLVQQSKQLIEEEKYEEAEEKAREAVKLDPKSAPALAVLGDALLYQSKNSEGGDAAKRAVDADRKNPTAHRVLGSFYLADRQYAHAVDESNAALKLGPNPEDEAFANLTIGEAYVQQQLYDAASDAFQRAKRYDGNKTARALARMGIADVLAAKKNVDGGIQVLSDLLNDPAANASARPNTRAAVNIRLAKLKLLQSKPDETLVYCNAALETATLRGVRAAARVIEGLANLSLKRAADAIASTDDALRLCGDDKQIEGYARAIKGAALVYLNRKEEGRAELGKAHLLLPDDPDVAALARLAGVSV